MVAVEAIEVVLSDLAIHLETLPTLSIFLLWSSVLSAWRFACLSSFLCASQSLSLSGISRSHTKILEKSLRIGFRIRIRRITKMILPQRQTTKIAHQSNSMGSKVTSYPPPNSLYQHCSSRPTGNSLRNSDTQSNLSKPQVKTSLLLAVFSISTGKLKIAVILKQVPHCIRQVSCFTFSQQEQTFLQLSLVSKGSAHRQHSLQHLSRPQQTPSVRLRNFASQVAVAF